MITPRSLSRGTTNDEFAQLLLVIPAGTALHVSIIYCEIALLLRSLYYCVLFNNYK